MRTIIFFLFLLPMVGQSQDVTIPDANFLAALIEEGVDTNGDGVIQVSEAEVVDELILLFENISSLEGIGAFVNLQELHCGHNTISELVITNNPLLKIIQIERNVLTTIDISNVPFLENLNCNLNSITQLDVSNNLQLKILNVGSNKLTELDVTNASFLVELNCSINDLSELDVSNNLLLSDLNFGSNELSEIDISNNLELTSLSFSSNELSEIDVTPHTKLVTFSSSNNEINELDVSNNLLLSDLDCGTNNLTSLDLTNNINLTELNCNQNDFLSLDISQNTLLTSITCYNNDLTQLNVSNNQLLRSLSCWGNDLTELDLSNNNLLGLLNCHGNELTELDLSNNPEIQILYCGYNEIPDFVVSTLHQLSHFDCAEMGLTVLDLSQNPDLTYFGCSYNNLIELDVSNNPRLFDLACSFNSLNKIDVSSNPNLKYLKYNDNPIEYLNIANGSLLECNSCAVQTNTLRYVCIDQNEFQWLDEHLGNFIRDVSVNTYCNFSLNDGLNRVIGKIQYEESGNCDNSSKSISQMPFLVQDGTQDYKFWPAYDNEQYRMFFPSGENLIQPCMNNDHFSSNPNFILLDFIGTNDTIYQDFCVSPRNSIISDVAISFLPLHPPRAGEEVNYKIVIENLGNNLSSGIVEVIYPMDSIEILGSSDLYNINGNTISWTYKDLSILSRKSIILNTRNNSPMDSPPLNGGEILKFQAKVLPDINDVNLIDNLSFVCEEVVNSYDPNDKRCLQGKVVDEELVGSYLDYMIRFENSGNGNAINITIIDTLNIDQFQVNSLRFLDASHPVQVNQRQNIVEFIFKGINLSNQVDFNDGYVSFKIKTNNNLVIGDSISNKAYIYFDFNWPIITNDAISVIGNNPFIILDLDGDGFTFFEDCDDANPAINPDVPEIPYNTIDDDCDPLTLDDDLDQDGFILADDCDDTNASINTDQTETPYNNIDDDCDPLTLDDDLDQDGFLLADDCNDEDPNINPAVLEITYNGIDDDCDAITLDDDLDQDGFALAEDCDDANPAIYNGAEEVCDGLDNDCDESIDEGLQEFVYYTDSDGDGYGDPLSYFEDCMELTGYVSVGDDCNDEDATIYPGATEIPNNDIDEDCDGMDLVSSFHELEKLGVKIYPNPVKDLLYLEQSSSRILHLRIFNTAGHSVLRKEISSDRAAIEISGLASGIYLIRLTQNEKVVYQKIVVE